MRAPGVEYLVDTRSIGDIMMEASSEDHAAVDEVELEDTPRQPALVALDRRHGIDQTLRIRGAFGKLPRSKSFALQVCIGWKIGADGRRAGDQEENSIVVANCSEGAALGHRVYSSGCGEAWYLGGEVFQARLERRDDIPAWFLGRFGQLVVYGYSRVYLGHGLVTASDGKVPGPPDRGISRPADICFHARRDLLLQY